MNQSHPLPPFQRGNGRLPKCYLKVVILYDERTAATRAIARLRGVFGRLGNDLELNCDLWRFDLLTAFDLRESLALAGEGANLIVVAASCDAKWPASVRAAIEFLSNHDVADTAALVAFLSCRPGAKKGLAEARAFLEGAAQRGGKELLIQERPARARRAPRRVSRSSSGRAAAARNGSKLIAPRPVASVGPLPVQR